MVYQSDGCQQQQSDDHIEKPSVKVTAQRIPSRNSTTQVISREIKEIRDLTIPFL